MRTISHFLVLTILAVFLLTACQGGNVTVETVESIDFLYRMDLVLIPQGNMRTKPFEDSLRMLKIDKEVRHCIKFPVRNTILLKIPVVPEGARLDCAVGFKAASGSVSAGSFIFRKNVSVGDAPMLESVFVDASDEDKWHEISIDLAEYEGEELVIQVESSNQTGTIRSFLAHPMLVVPKDTEPNRVIIICIDTLRADTVGIYGSTMGLTPSLDSFAYDAVRYANCESASPWTLPSCASFQTGRFPGQIAADAVSEHLREQETTMAEVFRPAGYRCGSITNNRYISSEVGFFQGFEYQRESPRAPADEEFDAGLSFLQDHIDENVLLYIHLFDPHLPYDPPEPYLSLYKAGSGRFETEFSQPNEVRSGELVLTDDEKLQIEGLYNGCIAFADNKFGDFISQLKSLGIYDDTTIVVWADHGEEFWEHDGFEHGHSVYEEVTHVPLIIKSPGVEAKVIDTRVSLVDIMPTLLRRYDIALSDGLVGIDLFADDLDANTSRRMFIEQCIHSTEKRACLEGDWKLILNFGIEAPPELYNLAVDPGEMNNLADSEPEITTRLASELLLYSAHTDEGGHIRLYNLPDVNGTDYELVAEVIGGEFVDPQHTCIGTLVEESLGLTRLYSRVTFSRNSYISFDFNVEPETAEVKIFARIPSRPDIIFPWFLGSSEESFEADQIQLSILDDRISMSYPQARQSTAEGIYIWSVPRAIRDALENTISPEARAELDALGYLH